MIVAIIISNNRDFVKKLILFFQIVIITFENVFFVDMQFRIDILCFICVFCFFVFSRRA